MCFITSAKWWRLRFHLCSFFCLSTCLPTRLYISLSVCLSLSVRPSVWSSRDGLVGCTAHVYELIACMRDAPRTNHLWFSQRSHFMDRQMHKVNPESRPVCWSVCLSVGNITKRITFEWILMKFSGLVCNKAHSWTFGGRLFHSWLDCVTFLKLGSLEAFVLIGSYFINALADVSFIQVVMYTVWYWYCLHE